ncbi:MAG: GAF domain-containing sensor histidine kinase [Deltaproteobacteria bacterium]|nr:GAF domain-containing sensor histidine kinase [Deltaproteobacteria bacterium]
MGIGDEIIKEQLFFRKELKERVYWFINLRWVAVGAGLVGLAVAHFLDLQLPLLPLGLVVLFIFLCNIAFFVFGKRLESLPTTEVQPYQVFAHVQISLDLLALYLLTFLTGGLASPLLIFFIFHIVLAGILLSPVSCYVYAILVLAALGGLIVWQQADLPLVRESWLAAGILLSAYITTSVKVTLRTKGRELMRISGELDISNAKLTSLYEMIKEVGSHSNLQGLMDSATRNAAKIMGVKACSVKLLDPERECLSFASTHGLSQDYLSKECISIKKSGINRRIIEGSLYTIGHIDEEDYFEYPEDVRKEGIASMLCLPLKAENKTLGVFCVYSGEPQHFNESDARFFSLMTDLTALAMERLGREAAKTWFLSKAAHQLRSPLNAIQSMLGVISGGYLGPVSDKQEETLDRCKRRLTILGYVLNDLLKLAAERQDKGRPQLYPVDVYPILKALIPMYRAQALEKGLAIDFQVPESLAPVLGNERLVDELFSNLISNALKYTLPGGQVTVSLSSAPPDKLCFEVLDTGIGIPEADLPRLFSEFFRAENAKSMVEEGTGLGLVIVKEILDSLGGTIQVKSKVGQGTSMTCLLPNAPPEAGPDGPLNEED